MRIIMLAGSANTGFWPIVERFANAAAQDLGVHLEIIHFHSNPVLMQQRMTALLESPEGQHPDGIIFYNYKRRGGELLKLAERYRIPSILYNAGFHNDQNMGAPRERFRYWIGEILPDDHAAGALLAERLVTLGRERFLIPDSSHLTLVALEGNRTSTANHKRVQGLRRYLETQPDVKLAQLFHSKWKRSLAFSAFSMAMLRYPTTTLFWTASDSMALGIMDGAREKGWIHGQNFLTGGIDLLPSIQPHIDRQELAVSIGGHYAEGAWALIALFDYLKGLDFMPIHGVRMRSTMVAVGPEEREKWNLLFLLDKRNLDAFDFKKLSRHYNGKLEHYKLDAGSLFDQLANVKNSEE
ncbi:MAG: ABC transporter substrate-binding protein [Magnetococcales bacterium]|nr:ABC transporter substrate-binding protein [Magnetococcales bacterium]